MSFEEIPRHKPENHYNYSAVELAERTKALRDMQRDYPDLPYAWLEMTYDWHKHTDESEVKRIINDRVWEGNGREHPGNELKEIIN